MPRADRVLVAPREIAGIAHGLHDGLDAEGLKADLLMRWPHPFGYPIPPAQLPVTRWAQRLVVEEPMTHRGSGALRRAVSLILRVLLVPYIAARYASVVFIGQDTLLPGGWDRRLLSTLGVTTVTVFCGSEARPPYLDGHFAGRGLAAEQLMATREQVSVNLRRVRLAEHDSTHVVNHPGTAQFATRAFVDWTVLGIPTSAVRDSHVPNRTGAVPKVLHAPSDPHMKGTTELRQALDVLRTEGVDFEYRELTGVPHSEVLDALRDADLVVDQLYSDLLFPGLSTEAMAVGTPVLVFGYAGDLLRGLAGRANAPVGHYACPERLLDLLRPAIADAAFRQHLRSEQAAYVRSDGARSEVARRWAAVIRNKVPEHWLDVPGEHVYAGGCAVEQMRLREFLEAYLNAFGPDALGLPTDSPHRAAITRMIGKDGAPAQSAGI